MKGALTSNVEAAPFALSITAIPISAAGLRTHTSTRACWGKSLRSQISGWLLGRSGSQSVFSAADHVDCAPRSRSQTHAGALQSARVHECLHAGLFCAVDLPSF